MWPDGRRGMPEAARGGAPHWRYAARNLISQLFLHKSSLQVYSVLVIQRFIVLGVDGRRLVSSQITQLEPGSTLMEAKLFPQETLFLEAKE